MRKYKIKRLVFVSENVYKLAFRVHSSVVRTLIHRPSFVSWFLCWYVSNGPETHNKRGSALHERL